MDGWMEILANVRWPTSGSVDPSQALLLAMSCAFISLMSVLGGVRKLVLLER